jgi:O-antigen ligase
VALIILLAAILPLCGWLRRNPHETPKLWVLVGFLPFVMSTFHSYLAIVSSPDWPGYIKGVEVSVLDVLALTLYLSLPGDRRPLPFRYAMALYFLATVLSAFDAAVPTAALFYSCQVARIFLLYAIVAKACADPRVAPAILAGMGAGIIMEAGYTILQRFALGITQTSGTFIHQNSLGLVSHFVIFPYFALLLAGRRGWMVPTVVLSGAIIEVLTTSRGTVAIAGMGYAAVFILSAVRQWTPRKAVVLSIGVLALAILVPLAISSFEQRFADGLPGDEYGGYDERAAYKVAAAKMLEDHPLGVGANHFTFAANVGGYYDAAGVANVFSSRAGNVHNIYWLILAETGYAGLITFVILLIRTLTVAFRCGWRYRGDERGDLMLGFGVALLAVYIHSNLEWIFITFQAQYMWALGLGLVSGLAQQLGYWQRTRPMGAQFKPDSLLINPARSPRS